MFFSKFNRKEPLCNDSLRDKKIFPVLAARDRVNTLLQLFVQD
jgi:hypothetical protein